MFFLVYILGRERMCNNHCYRCTVFLAVDMMINIGCFIWKKRLNVC